MPHFLSTFIFLILTTLFTPAQPQNTTISYNNCKNTFSCGTITNVTYPFTGGDRPVYCGPPDYRLNCRDNTTTELTRNGVTYQILQHDSEHNRLLLARSDLYNKICPSEFLNTTLNSTIFNYLLPENNFLNLFYGCNGTTLSSDVNESVFSCNSSEDSYYSIGHVDGGPVCEVSISVPILRSAGYLLASWGLSLEDALMRGFSVSYSVPSESMCAYCSRSGGECGFDSDFGNPVCYCGNITCPFMKKSSVGSRGNQGNSNRARMQIGLWIGGSVLMGIGLGFLIFCTILKGKHCLASKSVHIVTKDISPSHSSKGLLTSPTLFRRSVSSYPSSNLDIGKGSCYFGVQVFDYTELEEATYHFNASRELGEGGFGTVYYGELPDGRVVAVKRLYDNNFRRLEQFMNEIEILTRLRHKNLVMLFGCTSKQSKELLLVYEYISNGTVADHLHGNRAKSRGLLSWHVRLNIAIETAEALTYLHKSDIIHRDVKTTNILLTGDFHVKVADFGLSRLFPTNVTHVSTAPQGTPGYVDPEYYQCYHLTEKSDVFSFGVVLIELISSLQAVDTTRHHHNINLSSMAITKIQSGALTELVDSSLGFETDSDVRRMILLVAELAFRCLQQERDVRPSMDEVLEGLKGIQDENLNVHKVDIVDILVQDDDSEPLNGVVAPPSSDSDSTGTWITGSALNSNGL